MQTPLRLLLDGWSDHINLYPKIKIKIQITIVRCNASAKVCFGDTDYIELINCHISFKKENSGIIMSHFTI